MAKASIHFSPIKSNSESHNQRITTLDYNYPDLEKNNETFILEDVESRTKKINTYCKKISGRKLQKNAEPIREAVVNLNKYHTMEDLKRLSEVLKEKKGIHCFQIYIHRDEGKSRDELNYHAHMIFDWQDKESGKMMRLDKADFSQIQTIVAETLKMERGELKVNSNRERLEAIEYKRVQETKKIVLETQKLESLELAQKEAHYSLLNKKVELDNIKEEIVIGSRLKTPPDSFQKLIEESERLKNENTFLSSKIEGLKKSIELPAFMILNNQPITQQMKMNLSELFPQMQKSKEYQIVKKQDFKKGSGMSF